MKPKRPSKQFREEYTEALSAFLTKPRHGGITTAQIIALWKIRYEHADIRHFPVKLGMPPLAWVSHG